jgi:hypothetical protein
MRYHKAANTLAMLMDEAIPRRSDGALDLCAECQRWMWFSGGYLNWLANQLVSLSKVVAHWNRIPKFVAEMHVGEERRWRIPNAAHRERLREKIKTLAFEKGRNFRVRTWTHGLVEIWRMSDDNDEARAWLAKEQQP